MTETWINWVMPILSAIVGVSGLVACWRYFFKSKFEIAKAAKGAAKELWEETQGRLQADISPIVERHLEIFNQKADRVLEVVACLVEMDSIIASMYDRSAMNTDDKRARLKELCDQAKTLCVTKKTPITYVLEKVETPQEPQPETAKKKPMR